MRLFFAVTLEEAAARAVADLQLSLRRRYPDPGLRWVGPQQLHYTLKFLGEVEPDRQQECCDAARAAVAGVTCFQLELAAIGAFPTQRAARVLWVGASIGSESLGSLAARLQQQLTRIGFDPEARPFAPHLTIARVKGAGAERVALRLLETEQVGALATAPVDALVLMQSVLSPRGATYSVVERFALQGTG